MHKLLVEITKLLLCSLSMVLTGLFAINFAVSTDTLDNTTTASYAAIALLLLIGITIDLSKYLFWSYRQVKRAYQWVSLGLVLFSWAASVSYFITQENHQLNAMRTRTPAYQNALDKIDSLKQIIDLKEDLLKKRLASRYHAQWDKSETLVHEIATLNRQVQRLTDGLSLAGIKEAQANIGSTVFFLQLAELTRLPLPLVTTLAYGLLALLIEVCALGTLSLSQHTRHKTTKPHLCQQNGSINNRDDATTTTEKPNNDQKKTTKKGKSSLTKRKDRLKRAILQQQVKPTFAAIKRGKYQLSQAAIKDVLTELYEAEALEKTTRGFRLTGSNNSDN